MLLACAVVQMKCKSCELQSTAVAALLRRQPQASGRPPLHAGVPMVQAGLARALRLQCC